VVHVQEGSAGKKEALFLFLASDLTIMLFAYR